MQLKNFKEYCLYIPNLPVLSPISRAYYVWQVIQFLVILHTLIQFPLIQTFGSKVISPHCHTYSWLFLIEFLLLILDILFNCNVSVLEKGEMLTDRWSIISKYGNRQLFIDLIGLTGFILQKQAYLNFNCNVDFGLLQWFHYLFLFKAVKLKKIVKKFEKLMNFAPAVKSYINLFKLFVFVFLVAHFLCCLWY